MENTQEENITSTNEVVDNNENNFNKTDATHESVPVFKSTPKKINTLEKVTSIANGNYHTVLPSLNTNQLEDLYSQYGSEDVANKITEEQTNVFSLKTAALKYCPSSVYHGYNERVKDSYKFTNSILNEKGKTINLRNLTADDIPRNKANQKLLLSQFMSLMGRGEKINIPLWHSGFRIVLSPPSTNDILALHSKITKSQLEAGKDTIGLSFSNDSAILHQYFLELFFNLMESCTLNVNLDEVDLREHISVLDLNIIYIAMLSAMYTSGIDMTSTCRHANIRYENGEEVPPVCTYSIDGKVDPSKLVWIDYSRLTKKMIKQMSSMASKTITLEEVKEYKQELNKYYTNTTYDITTIAYEEESIRVNFRVPNLLEYLEESNMWLVELSSNVRESITEDYTDIERDNFITSIKYLMRLNTYNSFVDSITIRGSKLDDRELIMQALTTNGKEEEVIDGVLECITRYIENASVAVTGMPAYTCPECKSQGRDGEQSTGKTERLKEIIPIDPSTLFFDLTAHKLASLAE